VTLRDPARFDVRGDISVGRDVLIDINVILEGNVVIEDDVVIGPNCVIKDSTLRKGVVIKANSHIEGAILGEGSDAGPFARLRPGTVLEARAHVGNFVELKNAHLGEGAKAGHLTYLGDAEVGARTNIGAGRGRVHRFQQLIGGPCGYLVWCDYGSRFDYYLYCG
jgi:bifunctional UDP-N-acetylglucosamine pyrophosphorylase/glucosamine-1-phosphate N-acetyltransferase